MWDCSKNKCSHFGYDQIPNHPECTAPMASLIACVSHFGLFSYCLCDITPAPGLPMHTTPKRRCRDNMLNNNQVLALSFCTKRA